MCTIKGWQIHKEVVLNYSVPHGNIKFVLYDDREGSPTKGQIQEVFLGPDNYCLVTVPPLVWNGFKGIGHEMALVANCSSIAHRADERSEEHTSELQSLMSTSYAVFCLNKKTKQSNKHTQCTA